MNQIGFTSGRYCVALPQLSPLTFMPVLLLALFLAVFAPLPVSAQQTAIQVMEYRQPAATSRVFVVHDDRGGVISERQRQIQYLIAQGTRIEIRGNLCLSSCTMYLGAPDVCVLPKTRFGFHGPSDHGRPLAPNQFEYWSQIIADHYPAPLDRWYLSTARHLTQGYYYLSGAQLITLGLPECRDPA